MKSRGPSGDTEEELAPKSSANEIVASLFPTATLQHLSQEDAIRCQELLGHGETFGVWETPEWMHGGRSAYRFESRARINLFDRLRRNISHNLDPTASVTDLLNEGVLRFTRYLLLLRLGPTRLNSPTASLDCTTILQTTFVLDELFAMAIRQRMDINSTDDKKGLLTHLTADDLSAFNRSEQHAKELKRLWKLSDLGLWNDSPPRKLEPRVTNPKGDIEAPTPENINNPYLPLPDDYLAEMGPRVLWLIEDLGPNLVHLSESIPKYFSGPSYPQAREKNLAKYFSQHTWTDSNGRPITAPPFPLATASGRGQAKMKRRAHWPPTTWEQVRSLVTSLQSAHLWIALLAMAGRISEIETLKRGCVTWNRDGLPYANGRTYKLVQPFDGVDRNWPAPDILVFSLGQQARIVAAWEEIAAATKGEDRIDREEAAPHRNFLWASLGASGSADPTEPLGDINQALQRLAKRIGLTDRPGDALLHAHRFRKTVARLAGVAIVDSPRVLQKLLGHEDIEVTLHYICTDKALAADIERVARELRIMRSKEVFEDVRASMETGVKKYGGGGVPSLESMIRQAKDWGPETSYELSVLLTANGHFTKLIKPGVICLKPTLTPAPCTCNSSCENRIEKLIDNEVQQRDLLSAIPILIEEGNRAVNDGNLMAADDKLRQIEEDLGWLGDAGQEFLHNRDLAQLREALA